MNDKQVENLFVTMIDDSYLHDKLTLNDVSSLTLEKAYITPAYYSSTKKIVMTEEMMETIYLAHEFGHYLFDYLDDDDLEMASTYVSKAQDNFTTSYISDTIIDDNYRFINKRMAELLKEQDEKIRLDISSLYQDGNIEECEEHTGVWAWKYPRKDGSTTLTKLQGNVVFNDVDFGYNEEKTILHHIKLYAEPGQKIAFVGATGAGKTTITNLINRFYDIQDGKIRYDGININKIKKADLRRSLGIVLQDTHLFTGTVADNIRYGKLDATDEQVKQAAKAAHVDHFMKTK